MSQLINPSYTDEMQKLHTGRCDRCWKGWLKGLILPWMKTTMFSRNTMGITTIDITGVTIEPSRTLLCAELCDKCLKAEGA